MSVSTTPPTLQSTVQGNCEEASIHAFADYIEGGAEFDAKEVNYNGLNLIHLKEYPSQRLVINSAAFIIRELLEFEDTLTEERWYHQLQQKMVSEHKRKVSFQAVGSLLVPDGGIELPKHLVMSKNVNSAGGYVFKAFKVGN